MRILAYGDSNTFGIGPMPSLDTDVVHPKGARWANVMAAELPEAEVIVEGLPGRTTVYADPIEGEHLNGLAVLPAIIGSHRPIDVLAVCLGTNDLKARFGLAAQDVALGMKRLLLAAKSSGHVRHCLAIAPPEPISAGDFAQMFIGVEARAAGLADEMARMAGVAGAQCLDAGAHIAVDPLDGIHWSIESHATLGKAVAEKIKEMIA